MYEDLFYLVNFIPALDLPSALPHPGDVNIAEGLPSLSANRHHSPEGTESGASIKKAETFEWRGKDALKPANMPPRFEWKKMFQRKGAKKIEEEDSPDVRRQNSGDVYFGARSGQNVPLEVAMFMSSWVYAISQRKCIDVPPMTQLHTQLNTLMDALASLERILTTPIPWSFNAHIWEVSWIYCLALPFQLIDGGFDWVTVGATVVSTR
jgi:hypothetical protein